MFRSLAIAMMALIPQVASAALPGAAPVRIAVIDDGVAPTRLLADLIERSGESGGGPSGAPTPTDDHGTAVATIIAEHVHRPVRILPLRVDDGDRCREDRCPYDIEKVRWALRTAIGLHVDLINLSIESRYDAGVYVLLRTAVSQGIDVVMAAGNDPAHDGAMRYAELLHTPRFTIVGAQDQQGRPAAFSGWIRRRCECEVTWRPGVAIRTQDRHGKPTVMDGTSFAAPLVTAELADRR